MRHYFDLILNVSQQATACMGGVVVVGVRDGVDCGGLGLGQKFCRRLIW